MMEYISYILITLGILISCLLLVRVPARLKHKRQQDEVQSSLHGSRRRPADPGWVSRAKRAAPEGSSANDTLSSAAAFRRSREQGSETPYLRQDLSQVPTPWGWPGHVGSNSRKTRVVMNGEEVHGISESMHRFVDLLFKEKSTVDDLEFMQRKTTALRALFEDRYGRASTMQEVSHRKVQASPPRDSSKPHDPSGNNPRVDVPKQPRSASVLDRANPIFMPSELKEVKTPWGW